MYAGVYAIVAFVAAWIVVFGSPRIGPGSRDPSRPSVLLPLGIIAVGLILAAVLPRWMRISGVLPVVIVVILTGATLCILNAILNGYHRTAITIGPAGLSALLTAPFLFVFARIAYLMWNREVDRGAVRYGEETILAGIHVLFIAVCVAVTAALWRRQSRQGVWTSILVSLVFAAGISLAFYWTVPRAGDDFLLLWLFLVPAFLFAELILLLTCLAVAIRSLVRGRDRAQPFV